jgi:hypothetical protein
MEPIIVECQDFEIKTQKPNSVLCPGRFFNYDEDGNEDLVLLVSNIESAQVL